MPLFLGLDCGTQGLTGILLEAGDDVLPRVVFEHSLEFDRDFPAFQTEHGVHRHADGLTVTAPPLMWATALDRMLGIIASSGHDVGQLAAVSGSAQQHGTVHLRAPVASAVSGLIGTTPVAEPLASLLSRQASPIWMDESTRAQCEAIDGALGGADATARLTGSPATERFAGPQIRKIFQTEPEVYAATRRIHLVSSFLASLLAGTDAPVEPGDGAGMNLMDIARLQWAPAALEATAPGLAGRLPPIQPSWTIIGALAEYWQRRHGLPPAQVVAWSGDNPCSLVGTGIIVEEALGISLGTSDTVFASRAAVPAAGTASHVFGSPAGGYMALLCFRNGSLARERVRDWFGLDWNGFAGALAATPAGNHGALMLPWFEPEITPRVAAGAHTVGLEPNDAAANVRAVVEGQLMAMANYAEELGGRCRRIVATGGASNNQAILQVMADVFDAPVYQGAGGNAACLGAALRAWHAWERGRGHELAWTEIVDELTSSRAENAVPIADHVAVYRDLRERYRQFAVGRVRRGA